MVVSRLLHPENSRLPIFEAKITHILTSVRAIFVPENANVLVPIFVEKIPE